MHRKNLILLMLVILLLSTTTFRDGQAQASGETETKVVTLLDLGYSKDETLIGIHVDRVFSIRWPESWRPEAGNQVALSFSHSRLLDPSSAVVVDWNGVRLDSTQLVPENANRGRLVVDVPEHLIVPGYNELRLEFSMGLHDDFCQDINDPNIWATIHTDTQIELSYSRLVPELILERFPYPFVEDSDLVDNQVTFLVPDEPTIEELNAVAIIAAKLGQKASYHVLNLDASSFQDAASASGDLIYVGLASRLPLLQEEDLPFVSMANGKLDLVDGQGKAIPEEAGVLWEQPAPGNPTAAMLVVTGQNGAGLLKAARALGSDVTYTRLSGPLGIVLKVPGPEPVKAQGQKLTLRDLGYEDRTARGVRDQTINFNIPLSLAWQIQSEILLDLHFAHSTLLDDQQSALNLSLNGSPVSNIVMNKKNAEDAWATLRLPARLFKVGDNKLTLNSTIDLLEGYVETENCGENYEEEAWVVIYSDSSVTLPGAPAGMQVTLKDYPYAYLGNPSLSELAFIVPEKPDLPVTRAVAQIAGRLGRYSSAPTLFPAVYPANAIAVRGMDTFYQILIGLPAENQAIQAINETLPLPFQAGANELKSHPRLPEVISPNGATGYIEVTQSESGLPRLVVSGSGAQGLMWAVEAVSDPRLLGRLKGDVAILDNQASLLTLQIREPAQPAVAQREPASGQERAPVPWVMWAANGFLALALLVIAFLWISELIRHRQEKKSYETLP